ncbi:F-box only protein [Lachnellula suecica]|uniref:F-box only protein n=1 Tax=Lachnellula suecica TaxID=602035 RepID=A0A8T9C8T1_9HELO|nr:F-box only protein [Lachnellula suecica]
MAFGTNSGSASFWRPKSFNDLPDEILQQVLYFVPPRDVLLSTQITTKRLYNLSSQPLLWRHHCRVQFKYWDPEHRILQKFLGGVGDVDWKALYVHRANVDAETTRVFNSIIEGQVNRIQKSKIIADFGYDAKDTLLLHCHADEGAEDYLARRQAPLKICLKYYANSVLDLVHRSKALAEWGKLLKGESIPLERAFGSFDLFVLHDQPGDFLEISDLLDTLVIRLQSEYANFEQLSKRKQAIAVVTFLRAHNITGLASELAYRDLQNNYIGIALQDQNHPSLPLISVAIFCAVAQRLGLDARCCSMPYHAHAMVCPPSNETLDGRLLDGDKAEPMYLDPYRSDIEVPVRNLRLMMGASGISQLDQSQLLNEASSANLIIRTAKNILATVHTFRDPGQNTSNHRPTIQLHGNPFADMDNAFYSALWAHFLFARQAGLDADEQRHFIPLILEKFEHLYPMDATLIEQYICPLFSNPSIAEHWELHETLRVVRAADQTPKQLRLRDTVAAREGIKYKVGQVFRHRRYAYIAVITGWDIECGMGTDWIAHNRVDSLPGGRNQSFYHALVQDTSIRYVAEENIEIWEPEIPKSLMCLAGRFFKRWDRENRVFVSNIRDEYPED